MLQVGHICRILLPKKIPLGEILMFYTYMMLDVEMIIKRTQCGLYNTVFTCNMLCNILVVYKYTHVYQSFQEMYNTNLLYHSILFHVSYFIAAHLIVMCC